MNRFLTWLGLVDETESLDRTAGLDRSPSGDRRRPSQRPTAPPPGGAPVSTAARRPVEPVPSYRPAQNRPSPDMGVVVRPGGQSGSVVGYTEVVEVTGFDEAKKIADLIRERIPVIVDLRDTEPMLVRRLIDFLSGLAYALDGSIRKVAEGVLLVRPPRVRILERELRRLAKLGLYDLEI